jgi:hypothetical protein
MVLEAKDKKYFFVFKPVLSLLRSQISYGPNLSDDPRRTIIGNKLNTVGMFLVVTFSDIFNLSVLFFSGFYLHKSGLIWSDPHCFWATNAIFL